MLSSLGSDSALVGNIGVLHIWCFSLAAVYTLKPPSFVAHPAAQTPGVLEVCAVARCGAVPRAALLAQPEDACQRWGQRLVCHLNSPSVFVVCFHSEFSVSFKRV